MSIHAVLRHLIDPAKLIAGGAAIYGKDMMNLAIGKVIPSRQNAVAKPQDMQELPLGKSSLRLIFSPGHAYHHYSVWDERTRNYFCGDVGGNSYREMDKNGKHLMYLCCAPIQYDPAAWHKNLDAMAELNPSTLCLCHYGALTNVSQALSDMHRLLDEVNADALKDEEAKKSYEAMEQVMWNSFWREYDTLKPAMERLHAPRMDEEGHTYIYGRFRALVKHQERLVVKTQ